ncbi:MAG: hypothetical protein LiPW30_670 [Parcubacteria group bacterium LiPW_30]|nr:MAG: hypothetical protein LiPW30_670 [Parcubacteria group bacterium LiPW_30]
MPIKPLSVKSRNIFFYLSIVIFLIAVPVLVLYTTGYRFGEGIISKTGGISVYLSPSGSSLYINGKFNDTLGFLSRSFFVQDLKVGSYSIEVKKEGYYSWKKNIVVYPKIVTENYSFLSPEKFVLKEITQFSKPKDIVSTTTKETIKIATSTTEYLEVKALFEKKKLTKAEEKKEILAMENIYEKFSIDKADDILVSGKSIVYLKENVVLASWIGNVSDAPYFFHVSTSTVATTTAIFRSDEKISNIEFYPGRTDVVLMEMPSGIFALQLNVGSKMEDLRPVFIDPQSKIRISSNGEYFIKNKEGRFYSLELP